MLNLLRVSMALQSTTFEDSSSMYQDVMVGNSDALF